jgi:hypothetical protein
MVQIEVFLNSIRLVNNIFYLIFLGVILNYVILGRLNKKERKILGYSSGVLFITFLMGILLTLKFIFSSDGQIFDILDLILVPIFIFCFVKLMIIFPQIKYRTLMRISLIFVAASSILMIFVRILFGNIVYSYLQFFLFIFDLGVVYLFTIFMLISIEDKEKIFPKTQ